MEDERERRVWGVGVGGMKDHERWDWEIRQRMSPSWMAKRQRRKEEEGEEEEEGNTSVFSVSQHFSS